MRDERLRLEVWRALVDLRFRDYINGISLYCAPDAADAFVGHVTEAHESGRELLGPPLILEDALDGRHVIENEMRVNLPSHEHSTSRRIPSTWGFATKPGCWV
jgi:hypothetical protein